jgi:hypothetical protein
MFKQSSTPVADFICVVVDFRMYIYVHIYTYRYVRMYIYHGGHINMVLSAGFYASKFQCHVICF